MDAEVEVDKTVCYHCVEEDFLAGYIRANAKQTICSYCHRTSSHAIAVPFDDLMAIIQETVAAEYEDAANSVPYDSREGGYQLPTLDTSEMLYELALSSPSDALMSDIVDSLPDVPWVTHDPMRLTRLEALSYGWEDFCRRIKHETRYLFFQRHQPDPDPEDIPPSRMLRALGQVIRELTITATLPAGTTLFRVRQHEPSESPSTLADLGPPPVEAARYSNRMSPAGISMLYASLDPLTAAQETLERDNTTRTMVTTGEIVVTWDLRVLDLTRLPPIPSVFDRSIDSRTRHGIAFIHAFRRELTQPVQKDGREHIEYVPSQVVTEYLRYRYRPTTGGRLSGILYPSSVLIGGNNCVLFISNADCVPSPDSPFRRAPPIRLASHATGPLQGHP